MNENERTPAETAADYAVHFADGFFVPCPCCGKEVKSPDDGFTSEKEAISNKAPATTKRGWHGLRKQKAPFALDCKRQ